MVDDDTHPAPGGQDLLRARELGSGQPSRDDITAVEVPQLHVLVELHVQHFPGDETSVRSCPHRLIRARRELRTLPGSKHSVPKTHRKEKHR